VNPPSAHDTKRMLDLAARLAVRGQGKVEPNPMVGAVLVRDGQIIGLGHHRQYGGPHAERDAIADCLARGLSPRGATIFVTLEPCNHHGKQPPCVDALIEAGIARVVIARRDPFPIAAGGAERLQAAGIQVEFDTSSPFAVGISEPFIKRVRSAGSELVLPWVIAKWAQTIDGRSATRTGESKWISSSASRSRVHRLRGRVDAILTGIGTVLADDPELTVRSKRPPRRTPIRVVADSDLDIPLDSALVRSASKVPVVVMTARELVHAGITADRRAKLQAAGVRVIGVRGPGMVGGRGLDLRELLHTLAAELGVATVLVEAGAGLCGSLMDEDLIDELVVYIAPLLLGDESAKPVAIGRVAETLSSGRRFALWRAKRVGDDMELTYRRQPPPAAVP
jgi:diaminohydroxyphosphoribosylaminopyrimidine deaminase / 5-amino-6-(5-phosphoribosylamino)uracil reductase